MSGARQVYTADSLAAAMLEFERAFGMTSEEFYTRHRADDENLDIPRFERHVWASLFQDVQRLRGDGAVMDRVSRRFAVVC